MNRELDKCQIYARGEPAEQNRRSAEQNRRSAKQNRRSITRNVENSVLQKSFKLASEMKYFDIKDLMEALPKAKRKTLARYLNAMLTNGNIVRDTVEYSHFIFVDDKPIKVKIGD